MDKFAYMVAFLSNDKTEAIKVAVKVLDNLPITGILKHQTRKKDELSNSVTASS